MKEDYTKKVLKEEFGWSDALRGVLIGIVQIAVSIVIFKTLLENGLFLLFATIAGVISMLIMGIVGIIIFENTGNDGFLLEAKETFSIFLLVVEAIGLLIILNLHPAIIIAYLLAFILSYISEV